jgi:hypothetical protein
MKIFTSFFSPLHLLTLALGCVFVVTPNLASCWAQSDATQSTTADGELSADAKADLLAKIFDNAELNGMFTVTGRPLNNLKEERYQIQSIRQVDDTKRWVITTKIQYQKINAVFPVQVDVEWAKNTPVITMDEISIPLLGTFSCRVLFHDGRYSGTWQHDRVGGHLFGEYYKAGEKPTTEARPADDAAQPSPIQKAQMQTPGSPDAPPIPGAPNGAAPQIATPPAIIDKK